METLRPDDDIANADWIRTDWSDTGVKTLDDLYRVWDVADTEEAHIAFLRWFVRLPIAASMPAGLSSKVQKLLEG